MLIPGRVEVHGSRPGAPAGLPPVRQQAVGAAAGEPPVLEGDPAGPAVRHGRPPGVVPVPVRAPSQELRGAVREPELRGGQRRRRATVGDRRRPGSTGARRPRRRRCGRKPHNQSLVDTSLRNSALRSICYLMMLLL